MAKVSRRYRNQLADYLRWRTGQQCGVFLRPPPFTLDPAGVSAAEAMMRWESHGEPLPAATSEPELLADYVQAKRLRDWHISEWRQGVKEGLFMWWEFIGAFGVTTVEARKIFGIPAGKV